MSNASETRCIFINFRLFNFNIESVNLKKVFVNHIAFCVITAALSVFTTCINSITAMAYWKSTELRKKTAHFLVMVLSLTDLGIGIICGPLYVSVFMMEVSLQKFSCILSGMPLFVHWFIGACSFTTLLIMNIERYFAIVHPIFHRTKVTKGRLAKCLIVLWILAGITVVTFLYSSPDIIVNFISVAMLLSMATIVYIYLRIYFTSSRSFAENIRKTKKINASRQGKDISHSERRQHLRNLKLVKSCFIVLVCYCICFMPLTFLNASLKEHDEAIDIINPWLITLNLSNSFLNSLIFFWRNKHLRKEALRILGII